MSLRARIQFSTGIAEAVAKLTTWASACTPASVRPDPWGSTFSPLKRPMAEASAPCTVVRPGCTCQPAKSAPSYERISLRLRTFISSSAFISSPEALEDHRYLLQRFTAAGARAAVARQLYYFT